MAPQKQTKAPVTKKSTASKKAAPSKKTVTPKEVPVVAASTPEPVVEVSTPEPVVSVANEVVKEQTTQQPFSDVFTAMTTFQANLQSIINSLNQLKSEYRALEKRVQREAKATQKQISKRRKKTGARQPSGFVKPTRISDELASFLGKEIGTEMARTSVTKEINSYIKEHDLKDPQNGRIIHPDSKLSKLLKVTSKDEVTYFNLQKYMSHHFQKATPSVTTSA